MLNRIIDSHHHVWEYDPFDYPWIPAGSPLESNFGFADLVEQAGDYKLNATVAVQARQSIKETDWLLSLAMTNQLCKAVVGWVPLQEEGVSGILERYADEPLFKGVRHVIQDEPDPDFMLRPNFLRGLRELSTTDLRYDILIFGHQLPNTLNLVDALPDDMPLVLDHIAKPEIRSGIYDMAWAQAFADLGRRSNVMCKLSGLVTEVRDASWDVKLLRPYVEHALHVFGPERLMFGSDWPVCLLKSDYHRWVSAVSELLSPLSHDERDQIFFRNAARFYGITSE